MKAWLASVLATALLLGDAAPKTTAGHVQSCVAQLSLSTADCANVVRTLATLADGAYDAGPTMLPSGFGYATLAGLPLRDGRFTNGSARALITTGVLDRAVVLIVA